MLDNVGDLKQRQVLAAFVNDLQKFLDVPIKRTSIEDLWDESPPQEAGGQALKTFLREDVRLPAALIQSLLIRVRSLLVATSIPFGKRSLHSTTIIKRLSTDSHSCLLQKAFNSGNLSLLLLAHSFADPLSY